MVSLGLASLNFISAGFIYVFGIFHCKAVSWLRKLFVYIIRTLDSLTRRKPLAFFPDDSPFSTFRLVGSSLPLQFWSWYNIKYTFVRLKYSMHVLSFYNFLKLCLRHSFTIRLNVIHAWKFLFLVDFCTAASTSREMLFAIPLVCSRKALQWINLEGWGGTTGTSQY